MSVTVLMKGWSSVGIAVGGITTILKKVEFILAGEITRLLVFTFAAIYAKQYYDKINNSKQKDENLRNAAICAMLVIITCAAWLSIALSYSVGDHIEKHLSVYTKKHSVDIITYLGSTYEKGIKDLTKIAHSFVYNRGSTL
jgi:hypothetical protein